MAEKKILRVPFEAKTGKLLGYATAFDEDNDRVVWKDNYEFTGALEFIGTRRGRSSAQFVVRDENDNTYPMFMSGALEVLQKAVVSGGKAYGKWHFCKRGQNYAVQLLEPLFEKDGVDIG